MVPHPSSSALLVVDMLVDYFDRAIWPESALPGLRKPLCHAVNRSVAIARGADIPVFWIRQAFQPDLSDAFPHMRRTGRAYTIAGTPGAAILPELDVRDEDSFVMKTRYSAFFRTRLDDRLRRRGVERLLLAGITTSWCIRSTATDAYQLDYEVVLVPEALAGFTTKDHEHDLAAMAKTLAEVVPLDALEARCPAADVP